jgi:hypothetical protein
MRSPSRTTRLASASAGGGAHVPAFGTDNGDGSFRASTAFAFTRDCSSRDHGDGGQGSGEDG